MFSTRLVISKNSSPCNNHLVTVPRETIIIGINTLSCSPVFFFNSLASPGTCSFFTFFRFYSVVSADSKIHNSGSYLSLLFTIIRSCRLVRIKWSVCISKFQRSLSVSFSGTDFGLCIYRFFAWSNFNFLHNSQWIILPTQSYLVLYSFCVSLQHSLIMWLTISLLSPT